jgi:tetratricopeptide (TPR) repeat protein
MDSSLTLRPGSSDGTLSIVKPGLLTLLAMTLASTIASAEEGSVEQAAFEAFEEASRLFEAEDYIEAAHRFEEAYRLSPSASVHYNIARSYELADEPGLAIEHYRAFLDARAGNQARRRQVQARVAALEQQVGWLDVTTDPTGAAVVVDGIARGTAPARVALAPGRHEVEARLDDASATEVVQVVQGDQEITVTIVREPPVEAEPEPPVDQPQPEFHPPGSDDRPAGGGRGIGRLHHAFFWSGLGLTLTSSILLVVYGVELLQKSEEYANLEEGDPREEELLEEGRTLESAVTALWIATGVLAGATVVVAVFTDWSRLRRRRPDAGDAALRLVPGPLSASILLTF